MDVVESLEEAISKIADYSYPCVEDVEPVGLEYVEDVEWDRGSRWTDYVLHVFKSADDQYAGIIAGYGKTENQENDRPEDWYVVKLEIKTVTKTEYCILK